MNYSWFMKKFAREAINTLLILTGILSAGMGLKGFLMSSRSSMAAFFMVHPISDASGGLINTRAIH